MHRRKISQRTLVSFLRLLIFMIFGAMAFSLTALPALATDDAPGRQASLTADRLEYNPQTNRVDARGNVHLSRPDGEINGDYGTGTTDGRSFQIIGNVIGHFATEGVDVVCDFIRLDSEGTAPVRRVVTASGDVELVRGERGEDRVKAQLISWELDRDIYRASGNVLGNYIHYTIDADAISRDGAQFSATEIRRYHDKERDVTMSASRANGTLDAGGAIAELIAEGRVVLDTPDEKGTISRITGDKGVFSVARGTLVISGNAMVNQAGRNLHAESIVYHLDSERIEAIGRPSLVIDIPN